MSQPRTAVCSVTFRLARLATLALGGLLLGETRAQANGAFPAVLSVFFPARRLDALVVATNFGVVESKDGGRSWFYACEDAEKAADARLYTLVQDGDRERLFTVGLQGLAVSEDVGCTVDATAGSGDFVTVSDYFVDRTNAKRVFVLATVRESGTATLESAAVLLSEDGGRTFGPPLRSELTGSPNSLDFESIEVAKTDPRIVYLISSSAAGGRQFERSSDGGMTWQSTQLPANAGSRFGIITIDPDDASRVFVRGTNFSSDVLLMTRDGGRTLEVVLDLTARMAVMTAFLLRKDGTVLIAAADVAGASFGLKSTDGGLSYQPWDIGARRLRGLTEHDGRLYAVPEYMSDPFIVVRSRGDGEGWEPLLAFNDIKGIKPCAQARCFGDCLRLAALGVWSPEICGAPSPATPSRDGGSAVEHLPTAGNDDGCGCALGGRPPSTPPLTTLALLLGMFLRRRRVPWARSISGLLLLVMAATGCGDARNGAGPGADVTTITPWSLPGYEQVPLGIAVDLDPDPRRVEIVVCSRKASIPVRPDRPEVPMWTYDGWLPGPLIRARRGDTLVVRLRNELSDHTTIHWHGLRVPNEMDGTHETQAPVRPGGEFVYSIPLVDAGTFWYHPHHLSNQQVGNGLYGPLVVSGEDEPAGLGEPALLVLSDLDLDGNGSVRSHDHGGIEAGKEGREGSMLLVNGRQNPTLTLAAARRHRWLLLNASPNRFLRIAIAGHSLIRIGGDGGLLEKPLPAVSDLLLVPGERADVVFVTKGEPGDRIRVDNLPYDRGAGEGQAMHLMDLNLVAASRGNVEPLPTSLRTIERLVPMADAVVDQLAIGERPTGFQLKEGEGGLSARVGELRVYDIINHTIYDHPFHLHGFFFQVINPITSEPIEPIEWKDTYNVRGLSVTRFAVRYDDRPGPWMIHCHILDHAALGLFTTIALRR